MTEQLHFLPYLAETGRWAESEVGLFIFWLPPSRVSMCWLYSSSKDLSSCQVVTWDSSSLQIEVPTFPLGPPELGMVTAPTVASFIPCWFPVPYPQDLTSPFIKLPFIASDITSHFLLGPHLIQ